MGRGQPIDSATVSAKRRRFNHTVVFANIAGGGVRRPGADVARAQGLDLAAAGLHCADTPRHANVLLIAGPLPPSIVDAACVVWAQMPRPRAILALGAGDIAPGLVSHYGHRV